ncbi:E3 ubiquitin-protein ligase DCST1-like [Xenopus laevis]|uniref:E3 ubiquitin-protein ligase DCST1-like n=1 Tax=Xenopus laevis TaxID=8355 RepID=A0A8J1KW65_XENLA|nr:E3 ubiquitin-protein ligase DCST1-like [Xenopus laevis]
MEIEKKPELLKKKMKRNQPKTTLERILAKMLPTLLFRFFFSNSNEYYQVKYFLGAIVGLCIGSGKKKAEPNASPPVALFSAIFSFGWAMSTNFRCSTLMIFLLIMCQRTGALTTTVAIKAITDGPVPNMMKNIELLVMSFECTGEMTLNHTKMMYTSMMEPVKRIFGQLTKRSSNLTKDTKEITDDFREVEEEVESTEGYDNVREKELIREEIERNKTLLMNTQKKFSMKTFLRCEHLFEMGIGKCHEWFDQKYDECMETIWLPLLNHALCWPMKLKFVCGALNWFLPLCKKHIRIDPLFGELYDNISGAIDTFKQNVTIDVQITVRNKTIFDTTLKKVKQNVSETVEESESVSQKAMKAIKIVLSLLFLQYISSAFGYVENYNSNLRHDNVYITTYFKQIDARRRKQGKRHLLPLKKGERADLIYPINFALHGPEVKALTSAMIKCIPLIVICLLLLGLDLGVQNIMDITIKHSNISYNFGFKHNLEVIVGGTGFLARFLRNTIGNINTSSNALHVTNNTVCLAQPIHLTSQQYIGTCLLLTITLILPFVQIYMSRLRRVLAAYFYPKTEKRRILHLYNELLRYRDLYLNIKRKNLMITANRHRNFMMSIPGMLFRQMKWLRVIIKRRCLVCNAKETKTSYICKTSNCDTAYCLDCWKEIKKCCFVCLPDDLIENYFCEE